MIGTILIHHELSLTGIVTKQDSDGYYIIEWTSSTLTSKWRGNSITDLYSSTKWLIYKPSPVMLELFDL